LATTSSWLLVRLTSRPVPVTSASFLIAVLGSAVTEPVIVICGKAAPAANGPGVVQVTTPAA
jgi:hypothetical protein